MTGFEVFRQALFDAEDGDLSPESDPIAPLRDLFAIRDAVLQANSVNLVPQLPHAPFVGASA